MLKYPIVVKLMSDEETREYHLKRLYRLCMESIKKDKFYQKKGYYTRPSEEDQEEINKRLKWGRYIKNWE